LRPVLRRWQCQPLRLAAPAIPFLERVVAGLPHVLQGMPQVAHHVVADEVLANWSVHGDCAVPGHRRDTENGLGFDSGHALGLTSGPRRVTQNPDTTESAGVHTEVWGLGGHRGLGKANTAPAPRRCLAEDRSVPASPECRLAASRCPLRRKA
jgi:hypothetical protein